MMTTKALSIEDIKIGPRIRKDLGDIVSLAASMKEFGLLQPVVVTTDGRLLAGVRRIEAAKKLGWSKINVVMVGAGH